MDDNKIVECKPGSANLFCKGPANQYLQATYSFYPICALSTYLQPITKIQDLFLACGPCKKLATDWITWWGLWFADPWDCG